MMKSAIILLVFLPVVALGQMACTQSRCAVSDTSLRFMVLGDFGGMPIIPFFTPTEAKVAKQVDVYGAKYSTTFNMELGDNFYFSGVTDEFDSRFKDTFEDVFTKDGKPWYFIAGNHDHHGNVTGEIEYSKHSARWVYPDYNYTIQYALSDGTTVDMVMIDTILLCGNTRDVGPRPSAYEVLSAYEHEPYGPEDPVLAATQWGWLETQIAASKADYLFVMGHFPVWSIGEHGPTACLTSRLDPLLHKYGVSAYLNGHDHSLQHIVTNVGNSTVNYIVSGAGDSSNTITKHIDSVPKGSLKFHWPTECETCWITHGGMTYMNVTKEAAQFTFIRADGEIIYKSQFGKRQK